MSEDTVQETTPSDTTEVRENTESIEDRRAVRDFKFWVGKVFTLTFVFLFVTCILTLIYSAIFQEKDLNTTFIGEVFKGVFDILRLILS